VNSGLISWSGGAKPTIAAGLPSADPASFNKTPVLVIAESPRWAN